MGRTTGAFLFCATVTEPSCHLVNRRDPPAGLRELVVAAEDRHYGCPELTYVTGRYWGTTEIRAKPAKD
jgi:hypothetical protein